MFALTFNPPINSRDELNRVYDAIRNFNSHVHWINGHSLDEFSPLGNNFGKNGIPVMFFGYDSGEIIELSWSPIAGDYDDFDGDIYDGWEWVDKYLTDYDQTSGMFDSLNESEEEIVKPKIGDLLYCHTNLFMSVSGEEAAVKNKTYEIIKYRSYHKHEDHLVIMDERNKEHLFSFDPEDDAYFGNWFTLLGDSVDTESMFDQLNESDDDLGWAEDIVNKPLRLPPYDGNRHIIRLQNGKTTEDIVNIFNELNGALGWELRGEYWDDDIKSITNYANNGTHPYLALKSKTRYSYGSRMSTLIEYHGLTEDDYYSLPVV